MTVRGWIMLGVGIGWFSWVFLVDPLIGLLVRTLRSFEKP